jgi:hypothetical protein
MRVVGGGERSIMEGDGESEGVLNDIGQPALADVEAVAHVAGEIVAGGKPAVLGGPSQYVDPTD